jgi:hypothetical protein
LGAKTLVLINDYSFRHLFPFSSGFVLDLL